MDKETHTRDDRRGQLLGNAWLRAWLEAERPIDGKGGAASWAASAKRNEEPLYTWIWYRPYLTDNVDDEYRSQQVGRNMLTQFDKSEHPASAYWFARAEAVAGDDEWLFAANVLELDGWRAVPQPDGKSPLWTKVKEE